MSDLCVPPPSEVFYPQQGDMVSAINLVGIVLILYHLASASTPAKSETTQGTSISEESCTLNDEGIPTVESETQDTPILDEEKGSTNNEDGQVVVRLDTIDVKLDIILKEIHRQAEQSKHSRVFQRDATQAHREGTVCENYAKSFNMGQQGNSSRSSVARGRRVPTKKCWKCSHKMPTATKTCKVCKANQFEGPVDESKTE